MIYQIEVTITAPVQPTEVTDRVSQAIENLFPEATLSGKNQQITGTAHSVDHFSERLHEQAILDTARGQFFEHRENDSFSFVLKKQAAYEGKVNFAVGTPSELGDIQVRITVQKPSIEQFIDHIAPPTEDGKPIDTHTNREE